MVSICEWPHIALVIPPTQRRGSWTFWYSSSKPMFSMALVSKGHWLIHATELSSNHRHFNCSQCLHSKEWILCWGFKLESPLGSEVPSLSENSAGRLQAPLRKPSCFIRLCISSAHNNFVLLQIVQKCLWNERGNEREGDVLRPVPVIVDQ